VGQSLNFFSASSVTEVIILARSSQNYPSVAFKEVLDLWRLSFLLPYTRLHLGLIQSMSFDGGVENINTQY
jgi:hypothetical protein